jgi:hypothetical protein
VLQINHQKSQLGSNIEKLGASTPPPPYTAHMFSSYFCLKEDDGADVNILSCIHNSNPLELVI